MKWRGSAARKPDWVFVGLAVLAVAGCDNMKEAPQLIEADGKTYLACTGMVWSSSEGGLFGGKSFKVSFTDVMGSATTIRGIQRLMITSLPPTVPGPLPIGLPDPKLGRDKDGNAFREGLQYEWADGSKAVLKNGVWSAARIPNPACRK